MNDEKKGPQFNISLDAQKTPVLYTDMAHMNVNDDGVTIDFCQRMGNTNQMAVVSRIGMSREHAKKLVKKLSEILALTTAHSQTGEKTN